MMSKPSPLTAAGVLFAVLAIAVPAARSQTFTTIDPPGSLGASAVSINPAGEIVGNYFDAAFVTHGFLRTTDGIITSFDAPGAGVATFPVAITPQGLVVGWYLDANFGSHIFLRAKDGTFTSPEIPSPGAIFVGEVVANSAGEIAGEFIDSNAVPSVFLRSPGGKFTLFELPAAFEPSFFAPNITAINPGGMILGSYFDANFAVHGWLRTIDGKFTTFDAPNAAFNFFQGTSPTSINDSGVVTGFYYDTTENSNLRVFLRAPNGTFSSFDTPQLGFVGGAASINSSGAVAGFVPGAVCTDTCTSVFISFLRSANSTISTVSDPVAVQETGVNAINPAGTMIGFYLDANNVAHGFVRKP